MTRSQFARTIAARTGEPIRTVNRLGFQPDSTRMLEPEEIHLVLDCPFCGRAVPYPGPTCDGLATLAECLNPACDVEFDFAASDVYAA